MKRMLLLFACLAFMSTAIQAGELFRWTDREGKVNYGDTPPLGAINVGKVNFSSAPAQNDDLPYETRIAQQNFPVTLYVGTGCGAPCDNGRSLLNKRGIPFKEKALKTKEDIEAFKQLSGMEGFVPVLQVGNSFFKGFLESQWNSELDIAGYAKTASYRQRISQPAPATPEAPQKSPEERQSTPAESAQ